MEREGKSTGVRELGELLVYIDRKQWRHCWAVSTGAARNIYRGDTMSGTVSPFDTFDMQVSLTLVTVFGCTETDRVYH